MRKHAWLLGTIALAGCVAEDAPVGLRRSPAGTGPKIVFDIFARPLPVIPLPNDVATWPDPESPTGRRINASMVAPTGMERRARTLFDSLDGWGTNTHISIPFDAPLDLRAFLDQFRDELGRPDHDPRDDSVYVIDLVTGLPVVLDTGEGNFPLALDDPNRYYPNDPRGGQSNLVFETVDETVDGIDTDFDGVLDRPNLLDRDGDGPGIDAVDQVDDLVTFYERETDTLLLRPIIPLAERREYAVVVTNRLRGENGQPVRSPFEFTSHVEQVDRLAPLEGLLAEHSELYGDLGLDDVAFAWTFTTQSVQADLVAVDMGLRGEGPFAEALADFPDELELREVFGTEFAFCEIDVPRNKYVVPRDLFMDVIRRVAGDVYETPEEELGPILDSFQNVEYLTIAHYKTPYLMRGEPVCLQTTCDPAVDVTCPDSGRRELCTPFDDVDAEWRANTRTGEVEFGEEDVVLWISVPRERPEEGIVQPFPVAFYGHGYTSAGVESIGFAGNLARHGIASIGVTAAGHGLGLEPLLEDLARAIFDTSCLYPLGNSAFDDRARDLDQDGIADSGADFWTGYVFHTRDMVRQSVVDYQQAIRVLQTFDGERMSTIDYDGDGAPNLAGDFDGNGVVDFGGDQNPYYAWGQSLGGILSMIAGAADPAVVAAAPTSGSAGLIDVGLRSRQGGVKEAVILRVMGPLVLGAPVTAHPETGDPFVEVSDSPGESTACAIGQTSLWFVVPNLNETGVVELGCSDAYAPGDVVVAMNLVNDEVRCARAGMDPAIAGDTRFRIGLPSDVDDHLELAVYDSADVPADFVFGDECRLDGVVPKERLTDWGVEARFQGRRFLPGEPLSSPAEGLGLRRQSPNLRRFMMLAQMALDPADPANYARHYFLDPLDFGTRGAPSHNVLDVPTIGDMNVPINTGIAFARIAGLVPFIPAASPLAAVYPEYAATAEQEAAYGGRTPNQVLLDNWVIEGLHRLQRFAGHDPNDPDILFDPDDLDESRDEWNAPDPADQGYAPLRLHRPTPGTEHGMSGMVIPYVSNHGDHGFALPQPGRAFDIDMYMIQLLGTYFASEGSRLLYVEDPTTHTCLEDVTCEFLR